MNIERRSQLEHQPEAETEKPVGDAEKEQIEREAKDRGYDDDGHSKPSSDDEGYRRFETPEGEA